jgi:phosphoadenosine phosphosulfate reductase
MWPSIDTEALADATLETMQSRLDEFAEGGRRVFATSSFQTQSVPLLHMISKHFADAIEVVMIDTGFMFPETYAFAEGLKNRLGFSLRKVQSQHSYIEQLNTKGQFLFTRNLDRCCAINKVQPMEDLLSEGDVWLSGIRSDQTAVRAEKTELETDVRGVLRYHPMLAWTQRDIYAYIRAHHLPKHPLEDSGYMSIGCVPCTRKWPLPGSDARGGRWVGSHKTECGLHQPDAINSPSTSSP